MIRIDCIAFWPALDYGKSIVRLRIIRLWSPLHARSFSELDFVELSLMRVPQVAIVGRPNVGKSSLFNWLARRRLAIVDNYEGVTRDRMTTLIEVEDRFFELIDTGGMGIVDADDLTADVVRQIELAINAADVILLVVDVQTGLMPLDEEVAERLRGVNVPVILVANKADQDHQDIHAEEFHRLGRGHMISVSTTQNRNRDDLLQLIVDRLPPAVTKRSTIRR